MNDAWLAAPALARPRASVTRIIGLIVIVSAVTATAVTTGEASARFSYPFLDAGPLRPPDILYLPSYMPTDAYPLEMTVGPRGAGIDLEMLTGLASGGQLIIRESTRGDASVQQLVGAYRDEGELRGVLAVWRTGHLPDGYTVLHARIGTTLVVIAAPLSTAELFRFADSLRRGSSRELLL